LFFSCGMVVLLHALGARDRDSIRVRFGEAMRTFTLTVAVIASTASLLAEAQPQGQRRTLQDTLREKRVTDLSARSTSRRRCH